MFHATTLNKINPLLRKANYTISALLIIIFFFVLMIHLNKEVRDLDIWLHLKTGEQIMLNREVPLTDPFSFSKPNAPWINHEWLFQLLSFGIYNRLGFDGLIAMQSIVFIAIFLIISAMGIRNRNFLFVSTMLFILLLNSSYRFTIRPDMFSVLFLVIFIFILKEKRRFLWLLPFLQIIWTNFHGFFFLGPILIFIFALTEKNKRLWLIFLTSLSATIVNPQLIKGAIYPISTLLSLFKDNFTVDFIQELKRPLTFKTLFNVKDWFFYKALIIISIFSFRFNQKKFNLTWFSLWFIFLLFSLAAIRNIIYFAIIATIAIFYNVNKRFSYDGNFSNEKISKNKYYFVGRFSLIFIFSFCMIKNATLNMKGSYYDFEKYSFKSCLWGISSKNFPKKAADFILKEKLPPRLFNDFNSGSYLINRTFPLRKVFIDGRTEFYGDKFLKRYKEAAKGKHKAIEEIVNTYRLEGFLLTMAMSNFDEKLARYLFENPKWKAVYFDESAIIFLKDTDSNQTIIDRFYIDFKSWTAPKAKLNMIGPKIVFPHSYLKRGQALREMGCFKAAISEAREALKIMPNCAEAFELLGSSYLELKEYRLALENYRIAVALSPQALGWRNKYALCLYKVGRYKEAGSQLTKIIKSRPRDPDNFHALSLVFKKQGDFKKAEKMISKACQYNKGSNFDYLKLWAEILFELEKYKESLKKYKLTQQIQPHNTEINKEIEKIEKIL